MWGLERKIKLMVLVLLFTCLTTFAGANESQTSKNSAMEVSDENAYFNLVIVNETELQIGDTMALDLFAGGHIAGYKANITYNYESVIFTGVKSSEAFDYPVLNDKKAGRLILTQVRASSVRNPKLARIFFEIKDQDEQQNLKLLKDQSSLNNETHTYNKLIVNSTFLERTGGKISGDYVDHTPKNSADEKRDKEDSDVEYRGIPSDPFNRSPGESGEDGKDKSRDRREEKKESSQRFPNSTDKPQPITEDPSGPLNTIISVLKEFF